MRYATTKILGWLAAAMALLALGLAACAASETPQTDTQLVTSSAATETSVPVSASTSEEPAVPPTTDAGDHSHDHDHSHTEETAKLPEVSEVPADQQAILDAILEAAAARPEPDIRIVVLDGKLVLGKSRHQVSRGDELVIEVFSDQEDQEVHLHGYDLTSFAGPVTPALFEFTANLPGIWEVEFEATGKHIFQLAVS